MGGRGGAGDVSSRSLSAIKSSMEKSSIIQDAIQYNGPKVFQSSYWITQLENEISKNAFNRGKEITITQTNGIVSQLKKYVEKEHERLKQEKAEEAEKTRIAKEYFARTYNKNKEQREITSVTYKRADKRMTKYVDSVLGITRKRRR